MNYAEDRLDRRARSAEATNAPSSSSSSSGGAEEIKAETCTQDQLAHDLKRAHDVFERLSPAVDADSNEDVGMSVQSMRELRAAHELAGKTLRD